ncbi:MAG: HNH endonuclease, partial [Yaniella sp.]|nr:HNH endonuclease [Yaniella sp.]
PYIPPDTILRMMCNVSVSPVTLTGQRQVLSIGRKQRQFTEAIRRAILARDRGCAVPGCHWPAAWCELHHITYWSNNGETSTENGLMMCSHHHKALHANMLQIERVNGEVRFKLHPLIDPAQEPRQNYFWQN